MSDAPTFRDFAASIMSGKTDDAAGTLVPLLSVSAEHALAAANHFQSKMGDPAFLQKAMGLRQAVAEGTPEQVVALVEECFGLQGEQAKAAAGHLKVTLG